MAGTPETPEQRRAREQAAEQTPEPAGAARKRAPRKRAPRKAAAKTTARTDRVSRARDTRGAATSGNAESAAEEPLVLEASTAPAFGRQTAPGEVRAMSASAARIDLRDRKLTESMRRRRQAWQTEAWDYLSEVGEIRYTVNFIGNMLSKLRLFAAVRPDPRGSPIAVDDEQSGVTAAEATLAMDTLARLRSTQGGQSALVRNMTINFEVAGEGYLHGHEDTETGEEEWAIRSVDELVPQGDDWTLRIAPGSNAFTKVPAGDLVIRLWEPDPRFSGLATCAMRAVLSEAESVLLLSREIRAISRSRLNAGMLLVPSELDFGPPGAGEDETDAGTGKFGADLMESIITPIQNEGSAAAVAPWIVRGKSDLLKPEVFRHLSFARTMDGDLDKRIEARILRIARGLNAPVETTTGLMATTFANAGVVKQSEWDAHGEPRAVLVVDAWTAGYFQPALVEAGMTLERARDFFVWFDPSDAIASPDATDSADLGLEQGLISDDAWRRTKGFAEGDAPDDEERIRRMLFKAGLRDPTLIAELLVITGIAPNIHIPAPVGGVLQPDGSIANAPGQGAPAASTPPVAQLAEVLKRRGGGLSAEWDQLVAALVAAAPKQRRSDLGRKLMEMDRALRIRLLTAADQAMRRAMEKAGNRLKPKLGRSGPTRELAAATHPRLIAATLGRQVVEASGATGDELLDGAFDELAGDFGSWVEVTQADALAALEQQVGQLGPAAREELRAAQRQAVDQAKGQLLQDLQTLAGERLFDPTPGMVAGEADPTLSVPSWVVRKAMSVAGGGDPEGGGGQPLTSEAGGPAFGVATGPDIIGTAVSSGAAVEGYVWDYGNAPRTPFPPHEALDGTFFISFDDEVLINDEGWPDLPFYQAGDHDGCGCDCTPVLLEPNDESSG